MNSIAAGMESDLSDSDCDMVYNSLDSENKSSRKQTSSKKSREPEFVPVPKSAVINQNFNVDTNKRIFPVQRPRHQKQNNFSRHNQNEMNRWKNKRSVIQNSQLLEDLRYAVMQGNLPVVKSILDNGIWVDTILKAGWTPLMYACSAAHPEIVLHLLENKADPNYHKDMYTPLMATCASSKDDEDNLLQCCCHLIQFGAHVNVHERHLTTPLMFATREGHFKIVKKLLDSGATVHEKDNRGRTVLSWAALGGHGLIVHQLLSKGCDPQDVDFAGQMAADLARENGHNEIATVLERYSERKENLTESPADDDQIQNLSKQKRNMLKNLSPNSLPNSKEKYYLHQGELELFLNGIGLPYLICVFKEQHLDFCDLLKMSDEELEKIGISQVGVRKKILEAAKAAHKKEWEKSSLPNLADYQYISCPDAVAMMANIAKHLKYISTSVVYVRAQMQSQPRILELEQETASIHDLLDEMDDSLQNVKNLDDELRFLKLYLNKIKGNAEYIPGDLITEKVPTSSIVKKTMLFTFVAISIGALLWRKPTTLTYMALFIKSNWKLSFMTKS